MPNGTWLAGWNLNDAVTAAEMQKSVGAVYDKTLLSPAPSFDFKGLHQVYGALLIVGYVRADLASAETQAILQCNNDAGANYDRQVIFGQGSSVTASEAFAGPGAQVASIPSANAPANLFAAFTARISHYAGSANNKVVRSRWGDKLSTSTANLMVGSAVNFWRSSSPVTRITILPFTLASSLTGNFVAGSRVTIYVLGV